MTDGITDPNYPSLTGDSGDQYADVNTATVVGEIMESFAPPDDPKYQTLEQDDTSMPAVETLWGPDQKGQAEASPVERPENGATQVNIMAAIAAMLDNYQGAPVRVISPDVWATASVSIAPGTAFLVSDNDSNKTRTIVSVIATGAVVYVAGTQGAALAGMGMACIPGTPVEIRSTGAVYVGVLSSASDTVLAYVQTERYADPQ